MITIDGPELINKGVKNSASRTINCSGGHISLKSGSIIAYSGNYTAIAIYMSDSTNLNISGGNVRVDRGEAIYSTCSSTNDKGAYGWIYIDNGAKIESQNGIAIHLTGLSLTNETFINHIYLFVYGGTIEGSKCGIVGGRFYRGKIKVASGRVAGSTESGINIQDEGAIVQIGIKDGIVSSSTPVIVGEYAGLKSLEAINFYDGIMSGKTISCDCQFADLEDCHIDQFSNDEDGFENVKLVLKNGKEAEFNAINNRANKIKEMKQGVVNVAKAYWYRGIDFQYDSSPITFQRNPFKKRNQKIAPEEVTSQRTGYTVCSNYCHQVYYEAFENALGVRYLLKSNQGKTITDSLLLTSMTNESSSYYKDSCVEYYTQAEIYTTSSGTEKFKRGNIRNRRYEIGAQILDIIEPGDIIARTSTKGGHVLLYVGDDLVLNSNGYKYDYYNKQDRVYRSGTVRDVSLRDDVLGPYRKVGLFYGETIYKVILVRPLDEIIDSDYDLTNNTKARKDINTIKIDKIASVERNDTVNVGDEITYYISLENKSSDKKYSNIVITDEVPNNTEFVSVSNGGTINGKELKWKVNVGKGKKVTISYTVRVNQKGDSVINDKTKVKGLLLNKIETQIGNTLTDLQIENIKSIKNGDSFSSIEALINTVYPEYNFTSKEELMDALVSIDKSWKVGSNKVYSGFVNTRFNMENSEKLTKYIINAENDVLSAYKVFTSMYPKGLFGGFFTVTSAEANDNSLSDDGRNLAFREYSFTIGDILLIKNRDGSDYSVDMYLCVDENKFATVKDGKVVISTGISYILDTGYETEDAFEDEENDESIMVQDGDPIVDEDFQNVPNATSSTILTGGVLSSLLAQDCFITLRPSLAMKEQTNLLGDIDEDGEISIIDVRLLLQEYINSGSDRVWREDELSVMDMNNDEVVNILDVRLLLQTYINS